MSTHQFANLVELVFLGIIGFIAISAWLLMIMTFMYGILKLVFRRGEDSKAAEPGQSPKKFVKKQAPEKAADDDAEMVFDDAEAAEMVPSRANKPVAVRSAKPAPEEKSSLADRLAADFDAQQVAS